MLYTWIIATRPWSFTAALIPISLGTALAWSGTVRSSGVPFHFFHFSLMLLCGILLQAGTNLLNTYGDFISGVDTLDSAVTCPQLVKGILLPNKVKQVGIVLIGFSVALGVILYLLSGWPILVFGVVGLVGAATYTTGVSPYKYKGLGPIFVFFLMGPCMVLPAYYVQAYVLTWSPFFASLPISFLVTAIMHANDLRDIQHDKLANINTVAIWLELKRSLVLYRILCIGAFVSLIFVIAFGFVPVTGILPLIFTPYLNTKLKKLRADGVDAELMMLEGWTAQFHFLFGITYIVGVLLWRVLSVLI